MFRFRQASRLITHNVFKHKNVILLSGTACVSTSIKFNAYCDAVQLPVPSAVVPTLTKIVVDETKNTVTERVKSAAESVIKYLRYLYRLLTYAWYGVPALAMSPVVYSLRDYAPQLEEAYWDYLMWSILNLGPAFIKMAQWASTRPDLYPDSLIKRLEKFQDDVPIKHKLGKADIEALLVEAYGDNWKDRLDMDLSKPIGSGCVAQVYKGTWKQEVKGGKQEAPGKVTRAVRKTLKSLSTPKATPEEVTERIPIAMKIIHPHVEKIIETDMELLSLVGNYIDRWPSLEVLSLGDMLREFAVTMNKQLDLRIESSNLLTFAKKFREDPWATFPKPIDGLTKKNILIETFMEGRPIMEYMKMSGDTSKEIQSLRKRLSDLGCRSILKMVFFDNFVHGDLHPGNILVSFSPKGEPSLIFLDCGIVYHSRSEKDHEKLVAICKAFMMHDGRSAARFMIDAAESNAELNPKSHKVVDADGFCEGIQAMVEDSEKQSMFEHLSEYFAIICDLAYKHHVKLDAEYFQIIMALKVSEGISLSLDRELILIAKCIPILVKTTAQRLLGIYKFPIPDAETDSELEKAFEKDTRFAADKI